MNYGGVTTNLGDVDIDIAEDMEREFSQPKQENDMLYGQQDARTAQSYTLPGGMDPNALKQAVPEGYSPLDQLRSALGTAMQAAEAVTALRTSLCGPPPPSSVKSSNVNSTTHTTLFTEMRVLAGQFEELAQRIQSDTQDVHSAFLGNDATASGRFGS